MSFKIFGKLSSRDVRDIQRKTSLEEVTNEISETIYENRQDFDNTVEGLVEVINIQEQSSNDDILNLERVIDDLDSHLSAQILSLENTKADNISPILTGIPTAPTAPVANNSTQLATTAFVKGQVINNLTSTDINRALSAEQGRLLNVNKANLASPALTGTPTAPTATVDINNTQIATTAYVKSQIVNNLTSTNTNRALSADQGRILRDLIESNRANSNSGISELTSTVSNLNTTLSNQITNLQNTKANIASPTFTGTPIAPTAGVATNSTQLATTAFVKGQVINNRTSSDTDRALSANQGRLLENEKAPNNHADAGTTFGVGTSANYGHVRLLGIGNTAQGTAPTGASNTSATNVTAAKGYTMVDAPTAIDLNDFREVGEWTFHRIITTTTNFPSGTWTGVRCILDVRRFGGAATLHQTLYRENSTEIWVRTSTSSTAWNPWTRLDGTLKANLASPALTGTPTAPTAGVDTNNTQLATTAYVKSQIINNLTSTNTNRALSAEQGRLLQTNKANLASPALTGTPTAPTATVDTNSTQLATTAYVKSQIINNLTSNNTNRALSAEQGRLLQNNKANNNHADSATTFGVGTSANYGHVRLLGIGNTAQGTAPTGATNTIPDGVTAAKGYTMLNAPASVDINEFREVGEWTFHNVGTTTNFPAGTWTGNDHSILEVRRFAGTTVVHQTLRKRGVNEIWVRNSSTATSWSSWVRIDGELKANIASPTFTGTPHVPTAGVDTNSTQIATTAYVKSQIINNLTSTNTNRALSAEQGRVLNVNKANLASPALTGTPTAPTAAVATNSTQLATTAFVKGQVIDNRTSGDTNRALSANQGRLLQNEKANLASPALTGTPTAPTAAVATNNTQIATTAYVRSQIINNRTTNDATRPLSAEQGRLLQNEKANLASPALTGTPTAPTAAVSTNNTQIATTAFVRSAISNFSTQTIVNNTLTSSSTTEALSANQGRLLQNNKANLASPALSGTPTAPTAGVTTNNTQIATTSFVRSAIAEYSALGSTRVMQDTIHIRASMVYGTSTFASSPEAGAWTPTGPSGSTIANNNSRWSRTGNIVYLLLHFNLSRGSVARGTIITIGGIPFTSITTATEFGTIMGRHGQPSSNYTQANGFPFPAGIYMEGNGSLRIFRVDDNMIGTNGAGTGGGRVTF